MKQRKVVGSVILALGTAPTLLWIAGAVGWIEPLAPWPVILITLMTTGVGTELMREKETRLFRLFGKLAGKDAD